MNNKTAKKIIQRLSGGESCRGKDVFCRAVDIIGNVHSSRYENNTFECSLHFLRDPASILNLNFYVKDIPSATLLKLRRLRYKDILSIINLFNKSLGLSFDYQLAGFLFDLCEDSSWPLQLGFDLNEERGRIKLYLSLASAKNDLVLEKIKSLAFNMGLDFDKIREFFYSEKIDAIGLDLNNNGSCSLKVYTFYNMPCNLPQIKKKYGVFWKDNSQSIDSYLNWVSGFKLRHIGFLCRISYRSVFDSIKMWARLDRPCLFKTGMRYIEKHRNRNSGWFKQANGLLNDFGARVSYLVLERNRPGIYFR